MKTVYKLLFSVLFSSFFSLFFLEGYTYAYSSSSPNGVSQEYEKLIKKANKASNRQDLQYAILYYNKALQINPNVVDFNKLGLLYCYISDYENALRSFEYSLLIEPGNLKAKKQLEAVKYLALREAKYKASGLGEPRERAPFRLHSLIEVDGKLHSPDSEAKLDKIIDLVWSDNEGRKLLQSVIDNQIPIHLIKDIKTSNITAGRSLLPSVISYEHSIPYNYLLTFASINIKESQIYRFQDKDSHLSDDEHCIMVFVHELCHLIKNLKYADFTGNSKEEELIASIIGYNIASRILTGESLSKDRVRYIAYKRYNYELNRIKEYKSLPMNAGYADKMIKLGFELPYYSIYCDLGSLGINQIQNRLK